MNVSQRGLAAGMASAGLLVAVYLTLVHYTQGQIPLACSSSGLVDCERVTTSAQSSLGPVPVAVLGVVWFAVLLGMVVLEPRFTGSTVLPVELGWTGTGLLVALYLVFAELFLIGAICLWCTVIHALIALLFLLAVFRVVGLAPQDQEFGRKANSN
jgi:uncharacterized membrane protein